ncbi:hypothetical protein A2W14_04025 [Candidatus Gottesmanbacteria bacterium RBG_16_37_8]|uniref:PPM-type phosphatase domain-containing protein n=1 Tax=Candidatus Gottesmanbacteria bacterium RBG_16_37_8 TaxID=1798371 RepID=A0A1F5YU66_9BACT|nr:MAG: hypothetical protein A2W14_04025 [Candidatus Gottesmanbacteria bacterium RBG_16_37_8]
MPDNETGSGISNSIEGPFVQKILFDEPIPVQGFDIGVYSSPAGKVGGDFIKFFYPVGTDDKAADMGVIVADAVDKGPIAFDYSHEALKHVQTAASLPSIDTPEDMLRYVNEKLYQNQKNQMFITALLGLLDGKSGEFSYARAGHELLLLFDSNFQLIDAPFQEGQPLGTLPYPSIDSGTVKIPEGGILVIISDGIVDETDTDNKRFDKDRLIKAIQQSGHLSMEDLIISIEYAICTHQAGTPQFDDHSLVVVRRYPIESQVSGEIFLL